MADHRSAGRYDPAPRAEVCRLEKPRQTKRMRSVSRLMAVACPLTYKMRRCPPVVSPGRRRPASGRRGTEQDPARRAPLLRPGRGRRPESGRSPRHDPPAPSACCGTKARQACHGRRGQCELAHSAVRLNSHRPASHAQPAARQDAVHTADHGARRRSGSCGRVVVTGRQCNHAGTRPTPHGPARPPRADGQADEAGRLAASRRSNEVEDYSVGF